MLAAWQVDPAWPAVVVTDADDDHVEPRELDDLYTPRQAGLFDDERRALARRVAELHVERTRLLLRLHHAERVLRAHPAPHVEPAAAPAPRPHRGGHPGHRTRNDRLLALYESTPGHRPHLTRCRFAAQRLATETAAALGVPVEQVKVMPAATVRDAIAEALRHRDGLQAST